MKLVNQILEKIVNGEEFVVAGGEAVVSAKLSKVIAGVVIYSLVLQRTVDLVPDIEAETFDELIQKGGEYLRICSECNGIPTKGYFFDQEEHAFFCSTECVKEHMELRFGKGNWKEKEKEFGETEYWVKVAKDDDEIYDEFERSMDGCWRKYNIVYIKPFCFKSMAEQEDDITAIFD